MTWICKVKKFISLSLHYLTNLSVDSVAQLLLTARKYKKNYYKFEFKTIILVRLECSQAATESKLESCQSCKDPNNPIHWLHYKSLYTVFQTVPAISNKRKAGEKKQWLAGKHNHFFLFTLFSINPTNLKPLTPMSDQDRISPYNINTISSRQVMRIKKKISIMDYRLIQYQILHANITRTVWQIIRRTTNEILGVKG